MQVYICVYHGISTLLWAGAPWSFVYLSVCIISAKVVCERKPLWWILINDAFHDLSSFIRGMLLVLHVNSMIININLLVFNFLLPLKADSKPFSNLLVKSFIIKQWNWNHGQKERISMHILKHSKVISFQYMYKGKKDKIYHLFLKIRIISHNEILGINLTYWSRWLQCVFTKSIPCK